MNYARNYISELQQTLDYLPIDLIQDVIGVLHEARMNRRVVFMLGNGGSASTASHFTADLAKNTRKEGWPHYRVIGLTDNMALFSALANDEGYENVFAQQLANFVQPRDVVVAISASGNSPNVLKAMELANKVGATTIGFTGFDGGKLGKMVDFHLHVPSNIIEQVEDVHLMMEHLIVKTLRDRVEEIHAAGMIMPEGMQMPEEPAKINSPSLEMLYSISRQLEGESELRDLLLRTLQLSMETIGAASGSILMLDDCGQVVDAAMAYEGNLTAPSVEAMAETVKDGLAGWVVANRQAALVSNTQNDPRWLAREWELSVSAPRSAVSVPLMDGERVVGVLTLSHSRAGQFNQDHLVLLAAIAVFVSYSGLRSLSLRKL